ncbi:MAG: hypothetical protein LBU61_02085 [Coriobacteriales bacterium]|jgi:hypothetical protein|nr:hypothetical protein [Coriobacteriales bacterium]
MKKFISLIVAMALGSLLVACVDPDANSGSTKQPMTTQQNDKQYIDYPTSWSVIGVSGDTFILLQSPDNHCRVNMFAPSPVQAIEVEGQIDPVVFHTVYLVYEDRGYQFPDDHQREQHDGFITEVSYFEYQSESGVSERGYLVISVTDTQSYLFVLVADEQAFSEYKELMSSIIESIKFE